MYVPTCRLWPYKLNTGQGTKETGVPNAAPVSRGLLRPADEATIAALARETDTDQEVVKYLYEEELATLQAHASVKNFIGIIAVRHVREYLVSARKARRDSAMPPGHPGPHARTLKTRAARQPRVA